jgi:hypothetical protein
MPSQDDLEEGVRARLRELFGAVETARQNLTAGGGAPTEQGTVLKVLSEHLYPALDRKVTDSAASGAPAWHIAQMTSDMFESVPLRGPTFQPVRDAHKQLKMALAAAQSNSEREAEELEEIEARVRRVIPGVLTPLDATLLAQHGETMGKLGDVLTAVGNVGPAVVGPLETMLLAQHGETLGKLGDVQTSVGNVVPGVLVPLNTTLAAQHGETLGKFDELDGELDELEGLLKGLPQKLTEVLLKNLPDIVRNVVIAIKTPITAAPPVITAVHFATLDDLAKAQAADYIDATADRLGLLQGAVEVLERQGPVPPGPIRSDLIPPVNGLVVTVLKGDDPANPLTFAELDLMNTFKNQISPYLQAPVVPGVK